MFYILKKNIATEKKCKDCFLKFNVFTFQFKDLNSLCNPLQHNPYSYYNSYFYIQNIILLNIIIF